MAAGSKLAPPLENVVKASARGIGTLEVSIDKILWGNPSPPKDKKSSAKYEKPSTDPKVFTTQTVPLQRTSLPTAGQLNQGTSPAQGLQSRVSATPTAVTTEKQLQYNQVQTKAERPKPGQRLVASGLFNALDALNSVDLCNVISYAFDNINIKAQPRPERSTWRPDQVAFYTLQDQAKLVTTFIDKYTAYPNVFIGSYLGAGPNAVPPRQAVTQTNAPVQGGTDVQKYNMFFLLKSIGETFSFNTNTTGSLFTSEDAILLRQIPGLGSNLNFVNDFLGNVNKYIDYRQISTQELLILQNKVDRLRSACVTIQNLNFKNTAALVGNFLGVDVRSQVQRLSEFVDVTKLIPTLKEINNAIRSFIRIANQVQKIIATGQFIIKTVLLLVKVFRFIIAFFGANPLPLLFSTAGIQSIFQDAKEKAKDETAGLVRILKSVNALLEEATGFVRYLTVNAYELLRRLDTTLITLQGCQAMQGSDILNELEQTRGDLNTLLDQLTTYVIEYDSKTDPETALFGTYEIRVVDEEITDLSVRNKRRRGIALDKNGALVTQSDLTFATNPQVIIGEVKQKLVSLGLVRPELGAIEGDTLSTISESLTFLDNNDILQGDLNISQPVLDTADNTNESEGLGLNAFVNNLPGGKRLRKRAKTAATENRNRLNSQLAAERTQATQAISSPQREVGVTQR